MVFECFGCVVFSENSLSSDSCTKKVYGSYY